MHIVGSRTTGGGSSGFILALTSTVRILSFYYNNQTRSSGVAITPNVWTQVGYTRNDTNGVFYVNGAPVARWGNVGACNVGTSFRIGTGGTLTSIPFDGRIDEV